MENTPPTLSWQEAMIAITIMVLVWSGVLVVLVQLMITWRARVAAAREDQYRKLAEEAVRSQRAVEETLKRFSADLQAYAQDKEKKPKSTT